MLEAPPAPCCCADNSSHWPQPLRHAWPWITAAHKDTGTPHTKRLDASHDGPAYAHHKAHTHSAAICMHTKATLVIVTCRNRPPVVLNIVCLTTLSEPGPCHRITARHLARQPCRPCTWRTTTGSVAARTVQAYHQPSLPTGSYYILVAGYTVFMHCVASNPVSSITQIKNPPCTTKAASAYETDHTQHIHHGTMAWCLAPPLWRRWQHISIDVLMYRRHNMHSASSFSRR
jgi:hypothetical protein